MILVHNVQFPHQHILPGDLPFEPAFKTTALCGQLSSQGRQSWHLVLAPAEGIISASSVFRSGSCYSQSPCPQTTALRTGQSGPPVKLLRTPSAQKGRTSLPPPISPHFPVHRAFAPLVPGGSGDEHTNSRGGPPGAAFPPPPTANGSPAAQTCFNRLPEASFQAPCLPGLLLGSLL